MIYVVFACSCPSNRLKIFIPMTVMGLCILITINVGGDYLQDNASTVADNTTTASNGTQLLFSSIDKLSISNVPNGSTRSVYTLMAWHNPIENFKIVTERVGQIAVISFEVREQGVTTYGQNRSCQGILHGENGHWQ